MKITVRSAANKDCERVKSLIYSVLREYGLEPEPNGTDADLNDIEANYINRGGVFELLEDENGKLFGTVGLYPMNEKTVELRKMYFTRELRGQGFGGKTLQRMIEKAKNSGFGRIYLETATPLKEAIYLYEKFGFKPTCEVHSPRCDHAYELVF
jgi:N-acetylglutamate synthase-like GNAT family acetyltransferase